jgi:predicted nuclease of predicted toxin-antitoxin system
VEDSDPDMKLKLDENLSRHLKPVLIGLGHDVLTAADENLLSRPDVEVAACAAREGRILLSLDIEFADLRKHPPGSHPGIILFRPASLGPLSVNRFVERFVRSTDLSMLSGCVAMVEPRGIRVRHPP